jgi:hypothetical protein
LFRSKDEFLALATEVQRLEWDGDVTDVFMCGAAYSDSRQTEAVRVEYDILVAINKRNFDWTLQFTRAIATTAKGRDECSLLIQMPDLGGDRVHDENGSIGTHRDISN